MIVPLHWRNTTADHFFDWPAWSSTYPIVVWNLYQFYDNQAALADHYQAIQRLVAYLGSLAVGGIISQGKGGHMEPQEDGTSLSTPIRTPVAITSTAYYYRTVRILADAARPTPPGWGYMIDRGATTLWETWDGDPDTQLSRKMKLFGSIGRFFYREVAGLSPAALGFRKVRVRPRAFGDMEFARASVLTVRGRVSVSWRRADHGLALDVTIPATSSAVICLLKQATTPATVTEGGRLVWADGAPAGRLPSRRSRGRFDGHPGGG